MALEGDYCSTYFEDGPVCYFMEAPDWKPKEVSRKEVVNALGTGKCKRVNENMFFANVEKLRLSLGYIRAKNIAVLHAKPPEAPVIAQRSTW